MCLKPCLHINAFSKIKLKVMNLLLCICKETRINLSQCLSTPWNTGFAAERRVSNNTSASFVSWCYCLSQSKWKSPSGTECVATSSARQTTAHNWWTRYHGGRQHRSRNEQSQPTHETTYDAETVPLCSLLKYFAASAFIFPQYNT
jgi:hypothetical protein